MRLVKMRYRDDCAVASVATLTGLSHHEVLSAAKKLGYKPNSGEGANLIPILIELGFGVRGSRKVPFNKTFIANVESVNVRNGRHAIVVRGGKVYDPSRKKKVSFQHFLRTKTPFVYLIEKSQWEYTFRIIQRM